MKLLVPKTTTSLLVDIFIPDSASTTGAGKTGLAYNTASLTAYYHRNTAAAAAAITLATATVGTYTSGGFKEVDATNLPGVYQLGIPDAALAAGADSAVIELKGAAGMAPTLLEIQLTDPVYQAKIWMVDDDGGTKDLYLVSWFVDGEPITTGITSPTLQVIKASDGTDLVASAAMTQIAATGYYKFSEATNRITDGAAYIVVTTATIDGATRTFNQPMSRDS